jgi:hypothetical protein
MQLCHTRTNRWLTAATCSNAGGVYGASVDVLQQPPEIAPPAREKSINSSALVSARLRRSRQGYDLTGAKKPRVQAAACELVFREAR